MKRKNDLIWNAIDELADKVDRLKNIPPDVLDRIHAIEIAIPRIQENLSQLWEREATNNTKKGKNFTINVRINDEMPCEIENPADENKKDDLKELVSSLNNVTGRLRDEIAAQQREIKELRGEVERLNEKIEEIKGVWLDWAKRHNRF